ncbi:MAG: PAS domain S-box protein, partial [Pseudomonadota bacterium]
MKIRTRKGRIWARPDLWRIVAIMAACSLVYYLPTVAGVLGRADVQTALNKLHDFYGIDFYALVFFIPVVYAAFVLGVIESVVTALVAMLILVPYAMSVASYPGSLFRPTAFAIILSAVGAVVAMLQKGDEQRRRSMNELKCLYDVGKAADGSSSIDRFLMLVVEIIPRTMCSHDELRVRITLRDRAFRSPGFEASGSKVQEALVAGDEVLGSLEIYSNRNHSYLKQQHHLVRTLAERIAGAVRGIEMEQALKGYYEQLEDMVEARTSDLKQAQEQLRLLSNAVKSSVDGITLADMAGNLTFANESAQKMWGYTPAELQKLSLPRLYSPDDGEVMAKEVLPGSRDNAWSGELVAVSKDGSRFPVMVTTSPVRDENGKTVAIVGVHRDITETKEMRDKLIRSERLAAVGELASGVGHELRNPLNVIRNCAYLINMTLDGKGNEETQETLKLLDQQVDISNRIVSDLLDFTRVRPPSRASVDLNHLVADSLSWVAVPDNVTVVREPDAASPRVRVDPEQVGRAFANV